MMKSLLLLSFVALAIASPLQPSFKAAPARIDSEILRNITNGIRHPSDLIFGGQKATRGQFPWQAFLYITDRRGAKFICGGSLVSKRHILTAAHCTDTGGLSAPAYAMLGSVNTASTAETPGVQIKQIVSFETYPDYTGDDLHDDIAIITLKEEVQLSEFVKIVKIKEDDSQLIEKKKYTVSGFGGYTYKNGNAVSSPDLLYAEVDYIAHDLCKKRWASAHDRMSVWDRQICAGSYQKGAGLGDSGGPLQSKIDDEWFQIGVVSFGVRGTDEPDQTEADLPDVYTRISKYCGFITNQTEGDFKCL